MHLRIVESKEPLAKLGHYTTRKKMANNTSRPPINPLNQGAGRTRTIKHNIIGPLTGCGPSRLVVN